MQSLKDLLPKSSEIISQKIQDQHKNVSQEFQDYGYQIAVKLGDVKRASMYIKLAKVQPRGFIDTALAFTLDYRKAKNLPRIFMWKLKELNDEYKEKLISEGKLDDNSDVKFKEKSDILQLKIKTPKMKKVKQVRVKKDSSEIVDKKDEEIGLFPTM